MYKMYDKAAAIREIQRYLREARTTTRYVAPSGVYDENTRDAVILFQSENGIKESGTVDLLTFNALYNDYKRREISNKIKDILRQNVVFPLKVGDFGEEIEDLNKMLSELLDFYGEEHSLRESKYFSDMTELAHRSARKIFGFAPGVLDQEFYDRLLTEIKNIRKF